MSYSRAIEAFDRALALDPSLVVAHWGLGRARFGLAEHEAARAAFERFLTMAAAASVDPEPAGVGPTREMRGEAERILGALARERGEIESAFEHLQRARELAPRDALTPYELGLTFEAAGRIEEAAAEFAASIELDRNHPPSRFRHARALRRLGRADEAAREERIHDLLNQLLDDLTGRSVRDPARRLALHGELATLDRRNERARVEHARALIELGRSNEAALALDDLLKEQPALLDAYALRAEHALRSGDDARAAEVMIALRAARPDVTAAQLPPSLRPMFPTD